MTTPTKKFDPVEFYRQAGRWYDVNAAESISRSVVSRAYYAAFLVAREVAKITTTTTNVHLETAKYFKSKTDSKSLRIFNRLDALRLIRNEADYDLFLPCLPRAAGEALRLSSQILRDLGCAL